MGRGQCWEQQPRLSCSEGWTSVAEAFSQRGNDGGMIIIVVAGTSLAVQQLRILLPRQRTLVRSLVWEDSTCVSPCSGLQSSAPRAHAPQQEKPVQREARIQQGRYKRNRHFLKNNKNSSSNSCCSVAQSRLALCDPIDSAHQASLSFTEAAVRTRHGTMDWFKSGNGVFSRLYVVTLVI